MRHKYILTALVGIGSVALFTANAVAGEWGSGCGRCGYSNYSTGQVYYAPPTYSYAQPTITVYPHYVVQPNYIVHRTYVVPQTYYLRESSSYPFGGGYLVNQGQYYPDSSMVAPPQYREGYSTGVYPRQNYRHYRFPRTRLHYERNIHRSYFDDRGRRERRFGVSSYRVNSYQRSNHNRRTHYR